MNQLTPEELKHLKTLARREAFRKSTTPYVVAGLVLFLLCNVAICAAVPQLLKMLAK